MKETGAALAGEMSGHIFFADRFYGFDDATYAGARVLEILSKPTGLCPRCSPTCPPRFRRLSSASTARKSGNSQLWKKSPGNSPRRTK
jgi:phosphomannomutase